MKVALVLVVLCAATASAQLFSESAYQRLFSQWVAEHSKAYDSTKELFVRYENFKVNLDIITDTNAKNLSYTFGTNQFTDLTVEEFSDLQKYRSEAGVPEEIPAPNSGVPDALDWVNNGKVVGIKNQGGCGSCWAFASASAIESNTATAGKGLVSLSEQELVDCARDGASGCGGGGNIPAFKYAIKKGGLATEAAYPYTAKDGQCRSVASAPSSRISRYTETNGEGNILNMIQAGPVSIGLSAGNSFFQNYKSGILDGAGCPTNRDHAVVIVGYGRDAPTGKNFWRVRNSWGTGWGAGGYVWMRRGVNLCAVESDASQPHV